MPVEMTKEQVESLVELFNPETPIIHLSRENFDNIIFTLEKAWQDTRGWQDALYATEKKIAKLRDELKGNKP